MYLLCGIRATIFLSQKFSRNNHYYRLRSLFLLACLIAKQMCVYQVLYRPCHEKAIKDGGRFRKKFAVVTSIVYLDNALRCSDLVCGKGQRSLLRSFCKNTCPGFITEWIQNIVSVEIDFDRTLQRDWRTECISISSEPIILSLDQPSRDLIPTPTAYMYTDHIILSFNFYPYTYMTFTRRLSKPDSFNLKNITHEDFCRCLSSSSSSSSSTPSPLSS